MEEEEDQKLNLNVIVQEANEANSSNFSNQTQTRDHNWWIRVSVYSVFVLCGESVATLLGRLYYDRGGNSKWMAALVQIVGFPILLPYYAITLPKNNTKTPSKNNNIVFLKSPLTVLSIYISLGLLNGAVCLFHSIGLFHLPVSTYSLICATQLSFSALFSFFLNSQKFTPYIINSLVLLTISSVLLLFQADFSDQSSKVSGRKYPLGFIFTILASAGYGLVLSLTQFSLEKVLKRETFSAIMDMTVYQSLVATLATLLGLFISGDWKVLSKEIEEFGLGRISYVMTLTWAAISWQLFNIGAIGLILEVSSLFSNVISVLSLPVVPVLAVIFFHDKIDGVKVIALVLAIWGLMSYVYQHYLESKKSKNEKNIDDDGKTTTTSMEEMSTNESSNNQPITCSSHQHRKLTISIRIGIYSFFVLCGQAVATLLGRLYYEKGGKSKWMATLVQLVGFPIFLPYYFIPNKNHKLLVTKTKTNKLLVTTIYFVLGLLIAANCYLYSVGLMYLQVSTYSIILSSQLAFNAFFSFFLNSQKFTPYIINSLVLLTISSLLLVFEPESQDSSSSSSKISKGKYAIGFICTLGASAGSGLNLNLTQFFMKKVLKNESFSVIIDVIVFQSLVATIVTLVGLFASSEWSTLREEMNEFQLGKVSYVMTLLWITITWQIYFIGVVGLVLEVSSLFSNVISILGSPIVPIMAVFFFHENMDGVKAMAMVLAIWGFVSYAYQNYLDNCSSNNDNPIINDEEANEGDSHGYANESNQPNTPQTRKLGLWIRIGFYSFLVLSGQTAATLLGRLYYEKGGKSKWMGSFVQLGGFPILLPYYLFQKMKCKTKNNHNMNTNTLPLQSKKPSMLIVASVYLVLGLIAAVICYLYSVGLMYLPVSTYSIILASQLAFNAFFSFFLNSHKFTPYIINSLVLLTISSVLLVLEPGSQKSSKVSKGKYAIGFVCTVSGSAAYGLSLSLMQFFMNKVLKKESFSVIIDVIVYQSLVATIVVLVGLFASSEWRSLREEMNEFELGKVSYVMTLSWIAITWQVYSIGLLGLMLQVSSVFSNVISVLGLSIVPIMAVFFFHEKMDGIKAMAMVLAIWGFVSYAYQNYLDNPISNKMNEFQLGKVVMTLLWITITWQVYFIGVVGLVLEVSSLFSNVITHKCFGFTYCPNYGCPITCSSHQHRKLTISIRIGIYSFFVLCGQAIATLLGRLYYEKGGKSKWMATLVQLVGFPIFLPYYFIPNKNHKLLVTKTKTNKLLVTTIYFVLGLLIAENCYLYSIGLMYLQVSTYSIILSSQLAFNAFFSFFLNSQKFTPYIINSLVLLTISSLLLVFEPESQDSSSSSSKISKGKYAIGFICTLGASAGSGLNLNLTQIFMKKVLKNESFSVIIDVIVFQSLVATIVTLVGLFASSEWSTLREEMNEFQLGKVSYVMTLLWITITRQVYFIGVVGLVLEVSSLFSNVISVLGSPIVPIMAVFFFHENMDGVKAMAMVLAIWGFVSYAYQNYLDNCSSKNDNPIRNDEEANEGDSHGYANESNQPNTPQTRKLGLWIRIGFYSFLVLSGQTAATLLGRLYYEKGGKSKWMGSFVQLAGFPILLPYYLFRKMKCKTKNNHNMNTNYTLPLQSKKPSMLVVASVYLILGLIAAAICYLYSVGLMYLPVSTYSIILASQLAFNAFFSFFLNSHKFTPYIINSLVLLTISSILLVLEPGSQKSSKVSKGKYAIGFVCTVAGSAAYGLSLSLMQFFMNKVVKKESFSVIIDVIVYQSLVATVVVLVGLFASSEWRSLREEMNEFELGKVSYVMTLSWIAITWQVVSIGLLGLMLQVSSVFSNVISVLGLSIVPIMAVFFFHEKMDGIKAMAMFMAVWGFVSYAYQNYLDNQTSKNDKSMGRNKVSYVMTLLWITIT
ncbi:hypothetical protein G4B88_031129 [Cannabis sativa]|uniref:Uncharacterized protein n=1 Tax=Cannabis sativa TaxID=3483 RepID=A0A7J6GST0_CANSA|nr:hypothetical protein G4B88_031129 [Cannabis sativa]